MKVDNATEPMFGFQIGAATLTNVHDPGLCEGRPCVVHHPTDHHMRDWPTNWRADIRVMERTCPHGIGHPDPDDLWYHRSKGETWRAMHGCDGCCHAS